MNIRSSRSWFARARNPSHSFPHRRYATAAFCYLLASNTNIYSHSLRFVGAMTTVSTAKAPSASSHPGVVGEAPDPRFRTWPITATTSLESELRAMGLELPASAIDGTSSNSSGGGSQQQQKALSDALVSVGTAGRGGTGSFISKDGLIVTNWHVAYDAVRRASIDAPGEGVDYVRDGFVARSRVQEIKGPNYECWITEACVDVSDRVLGSLSEDLDPLKRADTIRDTRQEIAEEAQETEAAAAAASSGGSSRGIRCDVVEMIPNKSYVLFTYKRLRDVRIVYVPPKSLGNFGGDTDNFEWPRHTADFTLLRAYVPPPNGDSDSSGSWDGYHPDNVPYDSSSSFIRVRKPSPSTNIRENDMVFLLGFPGSTMRYAPTPRLRYADEVAVPKMVKDFSRKLQLIDRFEGDSPEAALKMGSTKKGLANELKRSKGKLVMMRKLKLLEERSAEEGLLVEATAAAVTTKGEKSVAEILERLEGIYDSFRSAEAIASALNSLRGIYGGSAFLAAAHSIHEYLAEEKAKPDSDRETTYRKRNLPFLTKRLTKRLKDVYLPHEEELVKDCVAVLDQLRASGGHQDDDLLKTCLGGISETVLKDGETAAKAVVEGASKLSSMSMDPELDLLTEVFSEEDDSDNDTDKSASWLEDPFVKVAASLFAVYKRDKDATKALISERDSLLAKLLEYQQEFVSSSNGEQESYPDCNGSLRISAGFVQGYQASDAVLHTPQTTLSGLLDKATEAKLGSSDTDEYGDSEFHCPDRLYQRLEEDAGARDVNVCLLYSTDTVGGNSGSPVMNSKGELVAINFDRQRQGLMNEYKWSSKYSRSIGVDVRYILWLIGDYDGATHLVDELIATE